MGTAVTCNDFQFLAGLAPACAEERQTDGKWQSSPDWLAALLPLYIDAVISSNTTAEERNILLDRYSSAFETICPSRIQEVRRGAVTRTMAGSPALSCYALGFLKFHVSETAYSLLQQAGCTQQLLARFDSLTVPVPQSFLAFYPPGTLTPCALVQSPTALSLMAQLSRLANTLAAEEDNRALLLRAHDYIEARAQRFMTMASQNPARALLAEAWNQAPPYEGLSLAEATVPTGSTTLPSQGPNIYMGCLTAVSSSAKMRSIDASATLDNENKRDQLSNMSASSRAEHITVSMRCPLIGRLSAAPGAAQVVAPSALMFNIKGRSSDEPTATAVSANAHWVAAALPDHTISVWSYAPNISPDGTDVISSAAAHTLRPVQRRLLIGHSARVTSIDFSQDGQFVLSGDLAGEVSIWSTQHASLVSQITLTAPVWQVAFAPGGGNYAVASSQGLSIYSFSGSAPLRHFPLLGAVACIAWHPSGLVIAAAGDDTVIRLYSLLQGRPVRQDSAVVTMDIHRGYSPVAVFTGHCVAPSVLAFSPDGTMLASGDADGVLIFHDMLPLPGALPKQDVFSRIHCRSQGQFPQSKAIIPDVPYAEVAVEIPEALSSGRPIPIMARFETSEICSKPTGIRTLAWARHGEQCVSTQFDGSVFSWNTALIRVATTPQDVCARLNQLREHRGFRAISVPKDQTNTGRLEELAKWVRLHAQTSGVPDIPLDMRPDVVASVRSAPDVLGFAWLSRSSVCSSAFGLFNTLVLVSFTANQCTPKKQAKNTTWTRRDAHTHTAWRLLFVVNIKSI